MKNEVIRLKEPVQCHLWQKEDLTSEDLDSPTAFESLCTFVDDSHMTRMLLRCKQCGQLYFYEFYEVIDWKEGNDSQYRTYFPIESEKTAEEMSKMTPIGLLLYFPRLQDDFPEEAEHPSVRWIGKK